VAQASLQRHRAGRYVRQTAGYDAFIPAPLPPDPAIAFDPELVNLLSRADQAIGRLDGEIRNLPNPNLFVAMYVRREAVLSSQIEGTQSTLEDLLVVELKPSVADLSSDVSDLVNYVQAMNYGLDRLAELPLSLRLIREIHAELLQGVRGSRLQPGEFRRHQNFMGPAGVRRIEDATFVPPPPPDMHVALDNFEKFLHDPGKLPDLIHVGVAHAQFETIHPFMDGNGRVGRLLITLGLVHKGVLHRPLLYLSLFLKRNRDDYYDLLMTIRDEGNWEAWLRFFLLGVAETAEEATLTARAIVELRERQRAALMAAQPAPNALRLLDFIYTRPIVNVGLVASELGVTFATANKLVDAFERLDLLDEVTGRKRDRVFRFSQYLALFETADDRPVEVAGTQETESVAN
jgi:Fic family protein